MLKAALRDKSIHHALFMDADALFMDFNIPISALLPKDGKQITISGDDNALLNEGQMLFNMSVACENLQEEVWNLYPPPAPWGSQSAAIYIFTGKQPQCRQSTANCNHQHLDSKWEDLLDIREQREMNSYISNFQPGDFILHFADAGSDKITLMKRYSEVAITQNSPKEKLARYHSSVLQTGRSYCFMQKAP
mmetsp:Transcript_107148/g.190368  ORF Transcript_107148/g.190368 Transcript_107148/m.190368 type:complete len:192 (-) Transcript_107148:16-591(-)